MFGFGKSKKERVVGALESQAIGGQSVIYRLFTQALKVPDAKVRKIELTYFSLSVLSYVFLRFYRGSEKEQTLDNVALSIIEASIPGCGEPISKHQVIAEYQQRYSEYNALLRPLFSEGADNPSTTLLIHLYKQVTKDSPKSAMLRISLASSVVYQYVADNIDFVKKGI